MTNEEITVKYYTSIKNTDAADRTWSPGDVVFATGPCGKGLGWRGKRIFSGCGRESVIDPWSVGEDGKKVSGAGPGTLPGDEKMGLDPAAVWWAPCSWSWGSHWAPMDPWGIPWTSVDL